MGIEVFTFRLLEYIKRACEKNPHIRVLQLGGHPSPMSYKVMLRIRVTKAMKERIDALVQEQQEELNDPSWQISAFMRDLLMERLFPDQHSALASQADGKCNTKKSAQLS